MERKHLGEKMEERNETKVSVTLGYTLNLGNFQSLRLDLGVVDVDVKARRQERDPRCVQDAAADTLSHG